MAFYFDSSGALQEGPVPAGATQRVLALVPVEIDGDTVEVLAEVYVEPGASLEGLNFRKDVTPGLALSARLDAVAGNVLPGVALAQRFSGVVQQTPGIDLDPFTSGTITPAQQAGVALSGRFDAPSAAQSQAGAEIVQITYNAVCTRGASTATSTGGNAVTNPANAQGLRNGTVATGAGNALGARAYQLNLAYPTITGKAELTITAAELRFYISQTGTALNNGGLKIGWSSTSRAYAQTNAFAANIDNLTTPVVVPITGVPLTFAEMASIVARINHDTAVLNTSAFSCDAVELVVTASRTDAL